MPVDIRKHIRQVGVLGAGTMGNGIAQAFAAAGYPVIMRDLKREYVDRGIATIARSLERLTARGNLPADGARCDARPHPADDEHRGPGHPATSWSKPSWRITSSRPTSSARSTSSAARRSFFATNTSSISVTQIAAASRRPDRVVGMHFFNPVPMMQLVEVIQALQTGDATCAAVVALVDSLGKKARVSKDSYGFVVNRVLIPMINEAINCVYEGLASPEDIDSMMKLGANHPMGPLSLADLIGLDVVLDIMETLNRGFDDPKFRPSPLLKQMCHAGYLGRKKGRGFFTYPAA
jgi:3-hydroxyacyl-CoA dehydrogenase